MHVLNHTVQQRKEFPAIVVRDKKKKKSKHCSDFQVNKKKLFAYYFANKGPSSQGYGFSCGHVWM